jgi:hypothetical protein
MNIPKKFGQGNTVMATKYHSLKLFRLLIGDVSQVRFSDMIGFDAAHLSRIEAGYKCNSARLRDAIRALIYPLASTDDIEMLLSGEMKISEVHRLAEAYARVNTASAAVGSPGGLKHEPESADAGGAPSLCASEKPAGDRSAVQDDAGASEQSGARASA